MRQRLSILILLLYVAAAACYRPQGTETTRPFLPPASSASTITAAEIDGTTASTLYDAIVQLRPGFFATRGSTSLLNEPEQAIVVIVNRRAIGGPSELRSIAVAITKSVKRLSAAEVFQITGLSAPAGGVEVVLGR
jgi:hypothetical protein